MSCQIVERCQAKGYCPASIPPPPYMGGTSLCTREALGAPAPVGARSGVGSCGNGGPGEAQRQRVRRGEEEQRSDCAFRPQGGNKGCGACDDEGPLACLSPLSFFTRRKMVPPAGVGSRDLSNHLPSSPFPKYHSLTASFPMTPSLAISIRRSNSFWVSSKMPSP